MDAALKKDVTTNDNSPHQEELAKIICSRIYKLRPKLLDMTRRNPLISTKFSERSNSLIRIIDEVPELLLADISAGDMRIVPLPDLGTTPKDKNTREFQSALAEARLNCDISSRCLQSKVIYQQLAWRQISDARMWFYPILKIHESGKSNLPIPP